jgi:hypothetical protein
LKPGNVQLALSRQSPKAAFRLRQPLPPFRPAWDQPAWLPFPRCSGRGHCGLTFASNPTASRQAQAQATGCPIAVTPGYKSDGTPAVRPLPRRHSLPPPTAAVALVRRWHPTSEIAPLEETTRRSRSRLLLVRIHTIAGQSSPKRSIAIEYSACFRCRLKRS